MSLHGRRTLIVVALAAVCGACSLFGPHETDVYVLTRVNGELLPATHMRVNVVGGGTQELQAVRGELRIFKSGRFEKERDFRDVRDGGPLDTVYRGRWKGWMERTDTTLAIRFIDERGGMERFVYAIRDSGRVLRGLEGLGGAFPAIYEYTQR